jgi:hypothetical protein
MLQAAKAIIAKNGPMGFYQGVIPYLTADGLSGVSNYLKFISDELADIFIVGY